MISIKQDLKRLLQKDNPIVLELGAHHGGDTKIFLSLFKNIRIWCFEPDPRCIQAFKKSVTDKRCTLVEAAVSSFDGEAYLNMSSGWPPNRITKLFSAIGLGELYLYLTGKQWDYSSSIKASISNSPKAQRWLTFKQKVKVKTIKLDSFIKENNIATVDFIWSDIQGAEKDMLEGAAETLKRCKFFYTEYGDVLTYPDALTRNNTIEAFRESGYELVREYSDEKEVGNLLFKNINILGL